MFASKLKKARESLGLTQLQAAKLIDIAPSSYSAYEVGKQNPKIDVLLRMCKEFNVSADWLLGLEKNVSEMDNKELLITLMSLRKSGAEVRLPTLKVHDAAEGVLGYKAPIESIVVLLDGTELKSSWNSLLTMEHNIKNGEMPESTLDTWLNAELDRLSQADTYDFNKYVADAVWKLLSRETLEVKRSAFD